MLKLSDFRNKKVLIMGLGLHGGGVGAAAFFAKRGSRVMVTDLKTKKELAPSIVALRRFRNITYHLGGHLARDFRTVDYIIKNPGVPEDSQFLKIAKGARVPVLSDVEIFFRVCLAPIIGITGTKGKSTTATLLYRILKQDPRKIRVRDPRRFRVWIAGNIRKSVLDILPRIRKGDLIVLELSSFQLDSLKQSRMSPRIAVITNIFPDHLNRYPSFRAYVASKANLFRYQRKSDYLFVNARDALLERIAKHAPGRVIRFNPPAIFRRFSRAWPAGIPHYHIPNIAAAIAVARRLGVGERMIRSVLRRFRGLPGRMEHIRTVRGVTFINDTTATNPEAAAQAVREAKRMIGKHRLHVIAGGYDKRLPVDKFIQALMPAATSVIFLPGNATEKMKSQILNPKSQRNLKSQIPKIFDAKTMAEAVKIAFRNTKHGDVVLLSPGAASFGLFKHEFDRGGKFVRAVRQLG